MTDIYKQHERSFPHVSAYVIAYKGERVATIAFKFPRDGAGRLYVYLHWLGTQMVRGHAGGYGYDKKTAACSHAAEKLEGARRCEVAHERGPKVTWSDPDPMDPQQTTFQAALAKDGGEDWDRKLRDAGFDVWQAV